MSNLFRDEVIESQNGSLLGTIRVGRRLDFSIITAVSIVMAILIITFCAFGHFTRKSYAMGILAPSLGTFQITAAASGTVIEVSVQEGGRVKQGDVIATIDTDRSAGSGDTGALVLQNISNRHAILLSERTNREMLAKQRIHSVDDQIRGVAAQISRAVGDVDLEIERLAIVQRGAERFEQLTSAGFMSKMQEQQKQENLLESKARLNSAVKNKFDLDTQLQAFISEKKELQLQMRAELDSLDRQNEMLNQEKAEVEGRRRIVLIAPHSGVVATLNAKIGQAIISGQALATVLPATTSGDIELQAYLFIPSRAVGFVRPRQNVWLRYASFPYQKYGMAKGEIMRISGSPVAAQDLPYSQAQMAISGAQSSDPLYRIEVLLEKQTISAYGAQHRLKAGMFLEADIVQDQQSIWRIALEPLLIAYSK